MHFQEQSKSHTYCFVPCPPVYRLTEIVIQAESGQSLFNRKQRRSHTDCATPLPFWVLPVLDRDVRHARNAMSLRRSQSLYPLSSTRFRTDFFEQPSQHH